MYALAVGGLVFVRLFWIVFGKDFDKSTELASAAAWEVAVEVES